MFLETIGRLWFSKKGLSLFCLILLTPFILAGSFLLYRHFSQNDLEKDYFETARKAKSAIGKKIRKEKFLSRYGQSDPYFLNSQIESIPLLEKEIAFLSLRMEHPALAKKGPVQERLQFLEKTNRIFFVEENLRTLKKIKETDENMRHAVQLDEMDLQQILSKIEDVPIRESEPISNMPQLVVRNMKLKRIGELFEMELQLLKREWIRE